MVRKKVRRTWEVRRTLPPRLLGEFDLNFDIPDYQRQKIPKVACNRILKLLQSCITIRITVWIQRSRYIYIYV